MMKVHPSIALTVLLFNLNPSSVFAQEAQADAVVTDDPLLALKKGDRWDYRVTVEAPRGATMPDGADVSVRKTAEGMRATFKKSRIYVGKTKPKEEGAELDTFQMVRRGQVVEYEFSDFKKDALYALGSKDETRKNSEVLLLKKPLLVYSAANKPGDQWEITSGDGEKTPIFSRKFRVFSEEEVRVPAGTFQAVRVVMTGVSGATEIKRTFWFTKGTGFIKEEKTYYSAKKRLITQTMELTKLTKGE